MIRERKSAVELFDESSRAVPKNRQYQTAADAARKCLIALESLSAFERDMALSLANATIELCSAGRETRSSGRLARARPRGGIGTAPRSSRATGSFLGHSGAARAIGGWGNL